MAIVDCPTWQSTVETGTFAGWSLRELVEHEPLGIVGSGHRPEMPFPLQLSYVINARRLPLSVCTQSASRHVSSGNNDQFWYVIDSEPDRYIFAGMKSGITQQQFLTGLNDGRIESAVQDFPAEAGDGYFLPSGRVFSFDSGVLMLRVRQHTGAASVLYDWERGTPELSRAESAGSVNFFDRTVARVRGESSDIVRNWKIPLLTSSAHLSVDEVRLVSELHDRTTDASCHLLSAVAGSAVVKCGNHVVELSQGRTCLLPARLGGYSVTPTTATACLIKTARRAF